MNKQAFLLVLLSVISFTNVVTSQSDHTLYLYDQTNWPVGGVGVVITNYVQDLTSVAFNDQASSLCVIKGIWLLYSNTEFNGNYPGTSAFFWGESTSSFYECHNLLPSLDNQVSSVRYAGSPWNYKDDAINIYISEWFTGGEVYSAGDSYDLFSYYGGSLIVTGYNTWTLYDSPNHTGYAVCVTPSNPTYGYPGFFPTPSDFGFSGRVIRSIRKGCAIGTSIYKPQEFSAGKLYVNMLKE